ncbi:MAG: hypothetical protein ACKOC6_06570 [bacterium]
MRRIATLVLAAALVALVAPLAAAHPVTPRVDRREARQEARIHAGVRSGAVSLREARRLHAGQRRVRRMEAIAKSDGIVTPRERIRLERAQDQQSRRIARAVRRGR